ncbi:hypothetical protein D3C73_1462400 [compost metagenome]
MAHNRKHLSGQCHPNARWVVSFNSFTRIVVIPIKPFITFATVDPFLTPQMSDDPVAFTFQIIGNFLNIDQCLGAADRRHTAIIVQLKQCMLFINRLVINLVSK